MVRFRHVWPDFAGYPPAVSRMRGPTSARLRARNRDPRRPLLEHGTRVWGPGLSRRPGYGQHVSLKCRLLLVCCLLLVVACLMSGDRGGVIRF